MYNFDFGYLAEQILEPILRTPINVSLLECILHGMSVNETELNPVYYNREKEIASWSSTKLQFEYILNKEYNIQNYTTPIFIQNYKNNDLYLYGYNAGEVSYKPLYFLDSLPDPTTIPTYTPTGTYDLYDIVKYDGILYECYRISNPPNNSLFNPTYWLRMNYAYNTDDIVSLYDFIVWIPTSLYTTDFELSIKQFIDNLKLFNTSYIIQYYG